MWKKNNPFKNMLRNVLCWLLLWCCLLELKASTGPVAVVSFSFPEAYSPSPHTVRIPFQLVGRLIMVKGQIGEVVGNFVVDTGADKLVLNEKYFDGDFRQSGVVAIGMAGSIGAISIKKVDSIGIEQLRWYNLRADLVDLSNIEANKSTAITGLIGYEVLKDYEILFDYNQKQLVLTALDEYGNTLEPMPYGETPYDSLEVKLQGHILCFNAQLEEETIWVGLDSGAELNLLDRKVNRKVLDYFKVIKRTKLVGAGGKSIEVLAGKVIRLRAGNIPCSPMNTLLTSLDELNSLYKTRIKGILGYEFFGPKRIAINYKQQKLYFFRWARP
jgi:hypothetical protein